MPITALPTAPSTADPTTFNARADALIAALSTFVSEANATAVAMNLNATTDTSVTSNAVGTGAKTFTVSAGKSFQPGMYLVIADTAAPSTNSMFGQVTSYSGTTLVAEVITVRGSGTKTAWTISQSSLVSALVQIQPVTATVAASALTATLNLTTLDFRSATLGSGAVNPRTISTAVSLVVPSGATLGTVSAVGNRLVLLALDNAGVVELAVVNSSGGNNLDETTLISTTALNAASDSANVAYSTVARSNLPFRVVGIVDSTQATAGAWATDPSLTQGAGGQAGMSLSSLGYSQTYQNVGGSRSSGVTYYNTTGRPIFVNIYTTYYIISCVVNGVTVATTASSNAVTASFIVPPGGSYVVTASGAITVWAELR